MQSEWKVNMMRLTKTVGPPFAPAVTIGAIVSEGQSREEIS